MASRERQRPESANAGGLRSLTLPARPGSERSRAATPSAAASTAATATAAAAPTAPAATALGQHAHDAAADEGTVGRVRDLDGLQAQRVQRDREDVDAVVGAAEGVIGRQAGRRRRRGEVDL